MGFLCILIGIVELLCCVLMPMFASLHMISEKYREKNKANAVLFKHWCFYWIVYFALKMGCCLCSILPSSISGILCFLRVALLAAMALPRLNLPITIVEFLQGRTKTIGNVKDTIIEFVMAKAGMGKK